MGTKTQIAVTALALLLPAVVGRGLRAGDLPAPRHAIEPLQADTLPPALPEQPAREQDGRPSLPPPAPPAPGRPIRLAESLALSLRNVETVQANLSVRTATVARFEALKAFVPLVDMPQLQVGLSRVTGPATGSQTVIFPDITGGTPFVNQPGLVNAELNRFNIFLPLDPSGHITALPIAEEGIRAKELMEQLVRRAQAVLAAQRYFEAKQIGYGQRVADAGAYVAGETLGLVERKLREKQAHDVELSQARVDVGRARVLVADLGKAERNAERRLGVAVHQCRLLVPQELGPVPIEPESAFRLRPRRAGPDRPQPGARLPPLPRGRRATGQAATARGAADDRRPADRPPPADSGQDPAAWPGTAPPGHELQEHHHATTAGSRWGSSSARSTTCRSSISRSGPTSGRLGWTSSARSSTWRSRCSRSPRMPVARGIAGSRRSASGSSGRPSTACGSNTAIVGRGSTASSRRSGSTCLPPRSTCSRATPTAGPPGPTSSSPGSTSSAPPSCCSTILKRRGSPPCRRWSMLLPNRVMDTGSSTGWSTCGELDSRDEKEVQ